MLGVRERRRGPSAPHVSVDVVAPACDAASREGQGQEPGSPSQRQQLRQQGGLPLNP